MVRKKVRLARVLDRLGVFQAVLEARAALPSHHLTIMTFHRVAPPEGLRFDPDVADTTPERFERQVQTLARYFSLVDTRDLEAHRAGAALPDNPAMITFDDGYRDNHDQALPILRRHKAKAVFFVATGYVAERRLFWWDRVAYHLMRATKQQARLAYPETVDLDLGTPIARERARARLLGIVKDWPGLDLDRFLDELGAAVGSPLPPEEERDLAEALVMSWQQVRALRDAGMDVQSHTHRHRVLGTLTEAETTADLTLARLLLEAQIERPVHALAYPSGRRLVERPELRRAVRRAGYRLGFTSATGAARLTRGMDWLDVSRVSVDADMTDDFFRGCLAIPALSS